MSTAKLGVFFGGPLKLGNFWLILNLEIEINIQFQLQFLLKKGSSVADEEAVRSTAFGRSQSASADQSPKSIAGPFLSYTYSLKGVVSTILLEHDT